MPLMPVKKKKGLWATLLHRLGGYHGRERKLLALFRDVTASMQQGFLYFGADGVLQDVNAEARRLLPCLPSGDAMGGYRLDNLASFLLSAGAGGETRPCFLPAGQKFDLLNGQTILLGENSALVQRHLARTDGTVVLLTDVSESRQQKAQLYQTQKLEALGQLAGGIAHDFNNLLSIIDGYTRMAMKKLPDNSPARVYLERIKQADKRGAALTKQLLTFGRHKIMTEVVVDLEQMLKDQENLLRPLLDATVGMIIRAEHGLNIECAPDGLTQALMNLVVNARDAMPHGGSITVEARRCDDAFLPPAIPQEDRGKKFACLSVTDTGSGMPPEVMARIFDPFFTTKEQGRGTGLGLSMVYGTVRQMKGHVDVRSVPGEGTVMSLYLPLSDRKPDVRAAIKKAAGPLRFDGYTALIAEDEPDLLHVVASMLEEMGMKVLQAANGAEALQRQDEYEAPIDFLLTDVVMPELNGVKLAELLAEVRPETKIVFMSGYPAGGTMARVPLPEGACLLAKPVEFEKLGHILYDRLQEKQGDSSDGVGRWQEEEAAYGAAK